MSEAQRENWRNRAGTLSRARRLRSNLTDAERLLWAKLRRRQMHGRAFRHQVPIGPYVADFACLEIRLVIEVDGGQHAWQKAEDDKRTAWFEGQGYRVLRFWNNEVLQNLDGVLEVIRLETAAPAKPKGWFRRPITRVCKHYGCINPRPNPPPVSGEGVR